MGDFVCEEDRRVTPEIRALIGEIIALLHSLYSTTSAEVFADRTATFESLVQALVGSGGENPGRAGAAPGDSKIEQRPAQVEALKSLAHASRVLFIAHREIILRQAMEAFEKVCRDANQVFVKGTDSLREIPREGPVQVFGMIQTIGTAENVDLFGGAGFGYVIVGTTPEVGRRTTLGHLADDDHQLEVVCAVDVLSEGVDVPSLTHVLLLRPTQSFIVFLQQLGRGLRQHAGKPFVTVLDFVGEFRNRFVSFFALKGFRSVPFQLDPDTMSAEFRPPRGCYISAETQVTRIWEDEIRKVLRKASPVERIRFLLDELVENEGGRRSRSEVSLAEFFLLSDTMQATKLIRRAGGWLRVRKSLSDATAYELSLVGTHAESFLIHIEADLHPSKSYKMAVLRGLLDSAPARDTTPVEWSVSELPHDFSNTT